MLNRGESKAITSGTFKSLKLAKKPIWYGLETLSYRYPQLWSLLPGGHSKSAFVVEDEEGSFKSERKRTGGGEGQAYLYVHSVKKIT